MLNTSEGWALIETVVAMALMGLAVSTALTLQVNSSFVMHRALVETQGLGLALEFVATQSLNMDSTKAHADLAQRLSLVAPSYRIKLDTSSAEIHLHQTNQDEMVYPPRWRLPIAP